MIVAIIALSLVVLTGLVGQISLAQAAFAGTAGFALSKIGTRLPFPLSLLAAAPVAAVLGVLVGMPALRIRGVQLAVVTLAAGVAIEQFVFRNPKLSPPSGNLIPDPTLFGIDLGVRAQGTTSPAGSSALLVLVVLTLAALAVANLTRSGTGRAFLAVRSNERAAASLGVNVAAAKLVAFALSSFLAGLGGALIGYSRGQLSADSFTRVRRPGVPRVRLPRRHHQRRRRAGRRHARPARHRLRRARPRVRPRASTTCWCRACCSWPPPS